MPATQFRNVVVFGDSLSDIGIMAKSGLGKFAKAAGLMTVNPTGRYSDCRNWTDYMYEMATGSSLVRADAATTVAASTMHQSLGAGSMCNGGSVAEWFRYANYAVGGACGGIPHTFGNRMSLTTMKDEVGRFRANYASSGIAAGEKFLFFVWFGANDLYTAGSPASLMGAVAEKVAGKRRNEIAAIVGQNNARFIFVNLGMPLSATRYQEVFDRRTQKAKDARLRSAVARMGGNKVDSHDKAVLKRFQATRNEINNFESGATLFNATLRAVAERNGDTYIDMASIISRESVSGLLGQLSLQSGVQQESTPLLSVARARAGLARIGIGNARVVHGPSSEFVSSDDYDARNAPMFLSTSDKAHPTDRVYRLMWEKIRETLWAANYTFGKLPSH